MGLGEDICFCFKNIHLVSNNIGPRIIKVSVRLSEHMEENASFNLIRGTLVIKMQ